MIELVFILDESGSMRGLEKDTIGGFNSTIDKQKKEDGDCLVKLAPLYTSDSIRFFSLINLLKQSLKDSSSTKSTKLNSSSKTSCSDSELPTGILMKPKAFEGTLER